VLTKSDCMNKSVWHRCVPLPYEQVQTNLLCCNRT